MKSALLAAVVLFSAALTAAPAPFGDSLETRSYEVLSPRALGTILRGGNRTLWVTIVGDRSNQFRIDPKRFRTTLIDIRTHVHVVLVARESHEIASHLGSATWHYVPYTNKQMLDLHYVLSGNVRSSMYEIRFDAGGGARDGTGAALPIYRESEWSLVSVPPFRPSRGDDANVRRLRHEYVGRFVYGIGEGIDEHCKDQEMAFAPTTPVQIFDIRRKYGTADVWTMGGTTSTRNFDTNASFLAIDPLEITFVTSHELTIASPTAEDDLSEHDQSAKCPHGTFLLSDAWEFERMISFKHPYSGRGWPAHFRRAIREQRLVIGMTPAMVAEVWGYPSLYGSRDDMEKLKYWPYAARQPFDYAVRFRSGHLVAIRPARPGP